MLAVITAALVAAAPYKRADYVPSSAWAKAHKKFLAVTHTPTGWLCRYSKRKYKLSDSVSVDHIVPLKYAHLHGMDTASKVSKLSFGVDTLNFALVSMRINSSKGDKGPSKFMPKYNRCFYVSRWDAVVSRYGLRIDAQDSAALAATRSHCR